MSTHKYFNVIAISGMVVAILLTALLKINSAETADEAGTVMGYEEKIFNTSMVHTIDIQIEDWEGFLETAIREEYSPCSLVIDGETYRNVGIRGKGNTSLASVQSVGNGRYSFKVEFDQYEEGNTYYGLDKLCLNNLYADNTYMKDYLCYTLMEDMGVASPLCSYVYLTVNGEDWGLYLAAEGVEESFLQRNYGKDYGELYKPDTAQMGENMALGREGANGSDRSGSDVKLQYIDDNTDSYRNIFENAKTPISDSDKERLIQSLQKLSKQENLDQTVDIESVIQYFVVHNFVCNDDSYTGTMVHNYYLYEENGRMSMIPWDYNLAFGGFSQMGGGGRGAFSQPEMEEEGDNILKEASVVNSPIDSPVSGGSIADRPMVAWIFDGGQYEEMYHEYYTLFIKENFADASLEKEIIRVQQMIAPYVKKDPTAFCTYDEFVTAQDTLKAFLNLRAESVVGQLAGTVPSTSEAQRENPEALVPDGDLDISLMGQMDMAERQNGPGSERFQDGNQSPQMPDNKGERPKMEEEGGPMPQNGQQPPSMLQDEGHPSEMLPGNEMTPSGMPPGNGTSPPE